MTSLKSPCKNCPDRTVEPNCHDPEVCARWAEYSAAVEKLRDARQTYSKTWAYASGRDKNRTIWLKARQHRSASKR